MNEYSNIPTYPDNISNQYIDENSFITKIANILSKSLSIHKNDREEADISTENLINFQFKDFLAGLSQIISDENFSKEIRQLAIIIIKNKILNKNISGEKNLQKFLELDNLTKSNFKKNIIATLFSNNLQVRRAISSLIAAIYKTEIFHKGDWTEAIENLVFVASNEKNENIFIESSLETLCFIIEEIGEKKFEAKLSQPIVDQALNCLFKNIQFSISSNNLGRLSFCLSLLNRIIPCADKNFKNDTERDFIMKTIFEIGEKILEQKNSENNFELLMEIILKSLIQISSYFYFSISDYFSEIYKLCTRVINSISSERIILFALEILCIIGDKEIEVSNSFISHSISTATINPPKKFFAQFSKELIQILSTNLVKISNSSTDTQDENTFHINSFQENELSDNLLSAWTISKACAYLLSIIARLSDSASLGSLLTFAETNFHSKDYLLRYSALLALCCSLDTAHKEIISNLLKCNFEAFFKTIADKVYLVSKTSSWLLCKISESYPHVIEKGMLSRYIPLFIRIIKEGRDDKFFNKSYDDFYDEDDPVNYVIFSKEIRINICCVLINLIKFYGDKNTQKNSNPISAYCMGMLNDLILTAANERADMIGNSNLLNKSREDKNINSSANLSYFALQVCAKIIEYSSQDLQEKLEIILNTLTEFLENSLKNIISDKSNLNFQENICNILEQIYRKIIRRVKIDLSKKTFRAIIASFVNRKDVFESGIFTITAMSTNMKEEFLPMLSEYMEYVFYSLKNYNESSICKSGIIAITNIICLYNKSFIPYVDRTLPILLEILADENISRSAKLLAISAIGEICLNIPESIDGNIVGIMQILFSASEVALHAVNNKEEIDEDTNEYMLQLKLALVEAFNSLIFGMSEINQADYLDIYLSNLLCYLKAFLTEGTNLQIGLQYSIICIIADIAQVYTIREVRKYIDQELLLKIINKIKTENNKIFMTNIKWAEKVLNVA